MSFSEDDSRPRNYLRDWREFRRLTQAELATMVGTTGSVISLIESGERGLSGKWLHRLAPALKTTPGHLLGYSPEQFNQACLDCFRQVPVEKRLEVVESLTREASLESGQGEVVTLPKRPEEEGDDGTGSKRNEME